MYEYQPHGVCSQLIDFDLTDDGRVTNVSFVGGCPGNLQAISKLVDGMKAEDVIGILAGNDCRGRGTSCADQFAIALQGALDQRKQA